MVVGPDTRHAVATFGNGVEILGIRLLPGTAAVVLREFLSTILDRTMPLDG